MITVSETEVAAEALPAEEQRRLSLFLAGRLRTDRVSLPQPPQVERRQVEQWIAEDAADGRRFRRP